MWWTGGTCNTEVETVKQKLREAPRVLVAEGEKMLRG